MERYDLREMRLSLSLAPAVFLAAFAPGAPGVARAEDAAPTAGPIAGFCEAPSVPVGDEACAILPPSLPAAPEPLELLVYLHGIVPPEGPSPAKANVFRTVAAAANRAGAVALLPRGVRGVGPKGAKDWFAWPTAPSDHGKHAQALVARWTSAKRELEAKVGRAFAQTFLAGSSNGAYFVAALALRGDLETFGFPVDGLGAMSGGASVGVVPPERASRPPFYVGYGTYDEDTKRNVASLASSLAALRWPSRVAEHPLGHGAREVYLDEAFAFWNGRRAR